MPPYCIDGKQTPGYNYYKRNRTISGFTLFPERRGKEKYRMIKPWTDIMSKQEMIEYLRVYLKQRGYKKQKQTWHRINQDRVYVIVNVQNSQWDRETYYINLGAGIDRQSTMKSFSFEKNKFSYRVYDGIGIEKLKEEITRWESIFDSELSILRNWDYISTFEKSYIGIDEDTREYFDELIKNEVNSTDIPGENS